MAFNQEAFLAALDSARAALDEIEMAAAAQKPEEAAEVAEEAGEGEASPSMPPGMMPPKKPLGG